MVIFLAYVLWQHFGFDKKKKTAIPAIVVTIIIGLAPPASPYSIADDIGLYRTPTITRGT